MPTFPRTENSKLRLEVKIIFPGLANRGGWARTWPVGVSRCASVAPVCRWGVPMWRPTVEWSGVVLTHPMSCDVCHPGMGVGGKMGSVVFGFRLVPGRFLGLPRGQLLFDGFFIPATIPRRLNGNLGDCACRAR